MKTLATILLFVTAGVLVGCGNSDPNADLVQQAVSPIADVPLPIGFELDEEKSKNRVEPTSGIRVIDHIYKGKEDKMAVAKFYRNRMPSTRWTSILDRFDNGIWLLQFQKDKEQCDIKIYEKGMFPKTYISISVGPVGSGGQSGSR